METCPVCKSTDVKRNGKDSKEVMTKSGKKIYNVQKYCCNNMHIFRKNSPFSFSDSFIEYAVYIYLRCLSFNATVDIIQVTYEKDVLSKTQVLDFLERVADALPTLDDIDGVLTPVRSGFLAVDGVWFSYGDEEIVLLVAFDPVSFDVIAALWQQQENYEGYKALLQKVLGKVPKEKIIGMYGDGDLGLLQAQKELLPTVPFQLCIVHKELRMGMLVPIKSVGISRRMSEDKKTEIKTFQQLFRNCIYTNTKGEAKKNLQILRLHVAESPHDMFKKAYRSLSHNFDLTLTHFNHPHMERDNNLLECFNGILKPRLNLMKGFKKKDNINRYLKLFLLEFRFRPLKESRFKERRGQSPLQLGDVFLPKYYNFLTFLREHFKLTFQPKTT
jgi:hypothetical protein